MSEGINYENLYRDADEFNQRIINNVESSVDMICNSLNYCNDNDLFMQKNINVDWDKCELDMENMGSIKNKNVIKFYINCKTAYRIYENINIINQKCVYLLFNEVHKRYFKYKYSIRSKRHTQMSKAINYMRLTYDAKSFSQRILSNVDSPIDIIYRDLCYCMNDDLFMQLNIQVKWEKYESEISYMNNEMLTNFYNNCKIIYNKDENINHNIDMIDQISVYLLFKKVYKIHMKHVDDMRKWNELRMFRNEEQTSMSP